MEDGTKIVTEKREIMEITAPVSIELAEMFLSLLSEHGATYEKGEDCSEGYGTAFLYKLSFPPGTQRQYGLMLLTSQPFSIVFPDGFILKGIDQYIQGEHRLILFVPRE